MQKFIIFSPAYNEKSGGIVVLHKLCHILNELGHEAKIFPHREQFIIDKSIFFKVFKTFLRFEVRSLLTSFKTNDKLNTPVITSKELPVIDDYTVVIYSELVLGNPLKAKNVVRWLLHQPGFHTGQVMYNPGELLFKFNSAIDEFNYPGSKTSKVELKVIHYPIEHYNLENIDLPRKGSSYCLRKGKNKKIVHNLKDSVLIDKLSHSEVAIALKKSKQFISYDTYTAYSIFAVLCGCDSIVVPNEGESEEQWYPNETDRYGIAYGFDNIEKARITAHLVKEHIIKEEKKSFRNVECAVIEINKYFFRNK
jgi:hypothetical protein